MKILTLAADWHRPAARALLLSFVASRFVVPGTAQSVPATPNASALAKGPVVRMSIFEVSGQNDEGYRSTQTISGSNTLENLRDIPNSISIMNRELIDDLNVTTVGELTAFAVTGESYVSAEDNVAPTVFRGMRTGQSARNGVMWPSTVDTFSIDRVEFLRGPNGFLYGEGAPGGFMNQVTKQAMPKKFERASLIFGSHRLQRYELDVNRPVTDKLAVRVAIAYQDAKSFVHHVSREFRGAYAAVSYKPFADTNMAVNFEEGWVDEVRPDGILTDMFSTTARTGATTAYTVTTGGNTLFTGTGKFYNTVSANTHRSTGTNIIVTDESILPRELNLLGPDATYRQRYHALNARFDQRIGRNLAVQAAFTFSGGNYKSNRNAGSSSTSVFLDTDRLLPDGQPNPNLNRYYMEDTTRLLEQYESVTDARVNAVYDLKLPFTTQRLVALGVLKVQTPETKNYSEINDPATAFFSGPALVNANTRAAHAANVTAFQRNYLYRRHYLSDGDDESVTDRTVIPGRSVFVFDPAANGGAAGRLSHRPYKTPSYGFGASGSYLDGKIRTLAGWRKSWFIQDTRQEFYNPVTGQTFGLPDDPAPHVSLSRTAVNFGGVLQWFDLVSPYFNYAQAVVLTSGFGPVSLVPGTTRGVTHGDGYEFGLRWSLLNGRIESNWTYYITDLLNATATPAIPAAARTELSTTFADVDSAGGDSQATHSTGFEFESVANLTRNWTLTWNVATNQVATADTYPILRGLQARAKSQGKAIPQIDAFLATVIDGTPVGGYTKVRSNLITRYRFSEGPMNGLSVGGGFQYRDQTFLGNFDLNRDGVAEKQWVPGYTLWNLMAGYRRTLFRRKVDFALNINNLFNKDYYRASGLTLGNWGEGTSVRFSTRIEF